MLSEKTADLDNVKDNVCSVIPSVAIFVQHWPVPWHAQSREEPSIAARSFDYELYRFNRQWRTR